MAHTRGPREVQENKNSVDHPNPESPSTQVSQETPRSPLKGSFKGDIDMDSLSQRVQVANIFQDSGPRSHTLNGFLGPESLNIGYLDPVGQGIQILR